MKNNVETRRESVQVSLTRRIAMHAAMRRMMMSLTREKHLLCCFLLAWIHFELPLISAPPPSWRAVQSCRCSRRCDPADCLAGSRGSAAICKCCSGSILTLRSFWSINCVHDRGSLVEPQDLPRRSSSTVMPADVYQTHSSCSCLTTVHGSVPHTGASVVSWLVRECSLLERWACW